MKRTKVHLERSRVLNCPAEAAWQWMCNPESLAVFHINPFHAEATCAEPRLQAGTQVHIQHSLGLWGEMRIARIATLDPFELAWGEIKENGQDWFPHDQRFTLRPQSTDSCLLTNRLRGAFHLPAARWWLMPWYPSFANQLLDFENRRIAKAVERA